MIFPPFFSSPADESRRRLIFRLKSPLGPEDRAKIRRFWCKILNWKNEPFLRFMSARTCSIILKRAGVLQQTGTNEVSLVIRACACVVRKFDDLSTKSTSLHLHLGLTCLFTTEGYFITCLLVHVLSLFRSFQYCSQLKGADQRACSPHAHSISTASATLPFDM